MNLRRIIKCLGGEYICNDVFRCLLCLFFILKVSCFSIAAQQNKVLVERISLELKEVDLKTVLTILEKKIVYSFIYSDEAILPHDKFSFSFRDKTLEDVLDMILIPVSISYNVSGKYIVLRKKDIKSTRTNFFIKNNRGWVVNENDVPLEGVSIFVKGALGGTITDTNGSFKIESFVGDTLVFSAVGFKRLNLIVGKDSFNKVKLISNVFNLEEVVVVGYGKLKRRDIVGAVSSLRLNNNGISNENVSNLLNGNVSGVYFGGNSTVYGSSGFVSIRGVSSLNPEVNNPLIIIDGLPMFGMGSKVNLYNYIAPILHFDFVNNTKTDYMFFRTGFERNPLNDINIDDIESIEILKDAYSTAIFGSRGATGVILIETKKGKSIPKLTLSSSLSVSEPVGLPSLLSGEEYSSLYSEYYSQKESTDYSFPKGVNTDWLSSITRKAISKDISISYSGVTNKYKYYFGISYLDKESYIKCSDYSRYTARFNVSYDLYDFLRVGINYGMYYGINTAISDNGIYRDALLKAPNVASKDIDGNYVYGIGENTFGNQTVNPVAEACVDVDRLLDFRSYGNIYVDFRFSPSFTFKSNFGVDWYSGEFYNRIQDSNIFDGGAGLQTLLDNRKYIFDNTLSFNGYLGKSRLNVVIGHSFESAKETNNSIYGTAFSSDNIKSISSAKSVKILEDDKRRWAMFSLFSRFNYSFNERYLLGLTYRLDGSSRFSKANRHIGFPSIALGWRISEMNFMKNIDVVSSLKLRSSLGYTGIDGSGGYYGNLGKYNYSNFGLSYADNDVLNLDTPSNPNLEWEKTKTFNIGFDISFMAESYSLSLDYYHKDVSNLLYVSSIASYKGFGSQLQNIGSMFNEGIEIEANVSKHYGDFSLSSYVNASFNRNELVKLNFSGSDYWGLSDGLKYFVEGQPAGVFLLYDWVGVDSKTGNSLWRYSDGSISEIPPAKVSSNSLDNKYIAGKPLPDWWGGLGSEFTYKNWSLNCNFSFSVGGKMFNATKAILTTYTSSEANNLSRDILNYWKQVDMHTDIPALVNKSNEKLNYNSAYTSDRFLEDASYLRLSNLVLAYRFDISTRMKSLGISDIKIYSQISNLFTLTGYSGIDPTVSYFGSSSLLAGYDELCLPSVRSFRFGFKIGF